MKKIFIPIFFIVVFFIIITVVNDLNIKQDNSFITLPNRINNVSKSIYNERTNIEKLKDRSKFYFMNTNFYNNITGLVATKTKKIIDISSYQGTIDWTLVKNQIDGVIIRIGYGSNNIDSKLIENISEIKRLDIPYGIYLYSYAENKVEALEEAKFTEKLMLENNLNPTLGVYYDIEEFRINGKIVQISKEVYQKIIETYINYLNNYNVSVYTYAKMYKYRFNDRTKKYVTWIAQYNYSFKYEPQFKMWQYTDSEIIDGIKVKVDMNVMFY